MTLSIEKDGLTYVIELGQTLGEHHVEGLLREDSEGWHLGFGDAYDGVRIGRRKSWQKALHDALVILEAKLREKTG